MSNVRIEGVSKFFGKTVALDEVDLNIGQGQLFFLLGPSGCGKTTLLRVLAGFVQPDHGSVSFNDQCVDHLPPHKRNTGMVFQNYALWPHMTVARNVAYGLKVRRLSRKEVKSKVAGALELVRMTEMAGRSPNELSGGQQQRVALARALVIEPEIILLDEPLSNLDAKLRLELRSEIRRIHDQTGITTVYVTHDQSEALSMADSIALMDGGKIIQVGTPRELYEHPLNRFVAEFIGETNFFRGQVTGLDGAGATLQTPLGEIPVTRRQLDCVPTDAVLCSIRPEAIYISRDGDNRFPCRFEAAVVELTYLGRIEQLKVKVAGDQTLAVHELHPRGLKAKVGDTVQCCFDPDDLILFEP